MNVISKSFHLPSDALRTFGVSQDRQAYASDRSVWARLLTRFQRHRQIRLNIRELSRLSDETLRDIGIERGNIERLVIETINSGSLGTSAKAARNEIVTDRVVPHLIHSAAT